MGLSNTDFFQSYLMVLGFFIYFDYKLLLIFNLFSNTYIKCCNFYFLGPTIICILASRYCDIYQLIPIITQLIFLLSPILYAEKNLGALSAVADYNPVYQVLALFRDSIIEGAHYWKKGFFYYL